MVIRSLVKFPALTTELLAVWEPAAVAVVDYEVVEVDVVVVVVGRLRLLVVL